MAMAMELIKRGADIAIAELVAREFPSLKSRAGAPLRKRWEPEEEEEIYSILPCHRGAEGEEEGDGTISALPYYEDDLEEDIYSTLPYYGDEEKEEEKTFSALPYYGGDEEEKIYSALPYNGDDDEDTYYTPPFHKGEGGSYPSQPYYEDWNYHTQFLGATGVEPWQLSLMLGVVTMGILFIVLLKYTVSLLITLASVEEPAPVYLPVESEDLSDIGVKKSSAARADGDLSKGFITSSIRGTLRHLRSEAGFLSAWRGFSAHTALFAATFFSHRVVSGFFENSLSEPLARIIGSVLIPVCLARLSMVCTHIMISKPQNATWLTRLWATPWLLARRTIPALVICSVASQLVAELSLVTTTLSEDPWIMHAFIMVDICLVVFAVFPATVALIRVQASFLPDDQESIVPFDRTFGKTDGQTGLTFVEAWKSVGKDGWKRIAKLFVKAYIPTFLLTIVVGALAVLTQQLFSAF